MGGNADEAATHASKALESTLAAFGPASVLTGHRQLRLGAVRMGQGRLSDAAELLSSAHKVWRIVVGVVWSREGG
eukprot:356735-Chlamydomonas_euryale.AAC.11